MRFWAFDARKRLKFFWQRRESAARKARYRQFSQKKPFRKRTLSVEQKMHFCQKIMERHGIIV